MTLDLVTFLLLFATAVGSLGTFLTFLWLLTQFWEE